MRSTTTSLLEGGGGGEVSSDWRCSASSLASLVLGTRVHTRDNERRGLIGLRAHLLDSKGRPIDVRCAGIAADPRPRIRRYTGRMCPHVCRYAKDGSLATNTQIPEHSPHQSAATSSCLLCGSGESGQSIGSWEIRHASDVSYHNTCGQT